MQQFFNLAPDLCTPNPCENAGVCVQDSDENYKCVCPYGFKGADCQSKLRAFFVFYCSSQGRFILFASPFVDTKGLKEMKQITL